MTTEPDPKPARETQDDEAEQARLDALAEAEMDAGKGVPHERVREWLLKLAAGERVPPPSV